MIPQYVLAAVQALDQVTDFKNKTILEIGGTPDGAVAKIMRDRGARRVVISNIGHGIKAARQPGPASRRLSFQYADALALREVFTKNSFDIVFGTAVLEHIPNIPALLSSIDSILRPGGSVFLSGGPLWTSARGHHVWVDTARGPIRFNDTSCPIPDWAHLVFSEGEMQQYLKNLSLFSPADIKKITHWIYQSPRLNRVSDHEILRAVRASGFNLLDSSLNKSHATGTFFEDARSRVCEDCDIRVANIQLVLRKGMWPLPSIRRLFGQNL